MTYQLDIDLDKVNADREWRLRCDGFYGRGHAWINGQAVGRFNGDYIGIDLDTSATLRPGNNRIVLQVCNRHSRHVLPAIRDPDFHLYGGMGGGMHLVALSRVRLSRDHSRIQLHARNPDELAIHIGMRNHEAHATVVDMSIVVSDPSGQVVATSEVTDIALPPGDQAQHAARLTIPSPQRWSPSTPHLYTIEATLRRDGQVCDHARWSTGLRTAQFDRRQGFMLNGKPLVLRGVNRHENLPGFGNALPRSLHEADALQIRDMGLNFVRLSHYPQSPAFLDACDRLGILVHAEVCSWKAINNGPWLNAAEVQMERMIRRDRHHPSIILWGLGNEGRERKAFRRLKALVRRLDPSRPTIYAENHLYRARRRKTDGLTDVAGVNYELDVLEDARNAAPTGCVVVTECANLPYARRGQLAAEIQQVRLMQAAIERTERAGPGVAGWALWCFADYATPRRSRWYRECGVVDGWRSEKMSAQWLRAMHGHRPFLSVAGDWSFGAGVHRRIYLLTNCRQLRVVRGDGSDETLAVPSPDVIERDVCFDGAPLLVSGRHADGSTVEANLRPWGEPASFSLRADAPLPAIDASEQPVCRCTLQVRDAKGVAVHGYEGEARFRLPPGVRASLIQGERLPVQGGQAAFYMEYPCDSAGLELTGALDDFPRQSLQLPQAAHGRLSASNEGRHG